MTYKHWDSTSFAIQKPDGSKRTLNLKGGGRWTLENSIQAGAKGCTAVDDIGSRLAAYVHSPHALGVDIQTICERHGSPSPGHHARYFVRPVVTGFKDARMMALRLARLHRIYGWSEAMAHTLAVEIYGGQAQ